MSVAFFRAAGLFGETVLAFATKREIPTKGHIDLLRKYAKLSENQQSIVVAMADSLDSLRKRSIDADITPLTMTFDFLVILEWAVETLSAVIHLMTAESSEIRASCAKLVKISQKITGVRDNLKSKGGGQVYNKLTIIAALSTTLSATAGGVGDFHRQ